MEVTLKLNLNEDIRRVKLIERNYESLQKQIQQIYAIERCFTLKYKDDEGDQVTISSQQEFEEALNCIKNNLLHLKVSVKEENQNGKDEGRRCGRFRKWRRDCKSWRNEKDDVQEDEKIENNQPHHHHPHHHFKHPLQHFQHFQHPFHHQHPHPPFNHPFHKDAPDSSFHHHPHRFPSHPFAFLHKLKEIAKNFIFQQSESSDSLIENFLNSGFCKLEHNHICDGCDVRISGTRYHCTECQDFDFCSDCFKNKINDHPQHKFEEITALQALKQALENGEHIDSFFVFGNEDEEKNDEVKVNLEQKLENEILEQEFEKQKIEKEKVEQERIDKERTEKEKIEQERIEKEKVEQERIKKIEQKKVEQERVEKERIEKEKIEQERIEKERFEQEKMKQEKIDLPEEKVNLSSQPNDILFPLRNQSEQSGFVNSFESKLQDLQVMGFNDRKKNIFALVKNKGDLHLAIEQLLNQN